MNKKYKFLDDINFPSDIKKLSSSDLKTLADELRSEMIEAVSVSPSGVSIVLNRTDFFISFI